jgi:uncharacterized membrane protein
MSGTRREPLWVDVAISRVLRAGVFLSIAVVTVGIVLTFIHHPSYIRSKPALRDLTTADQAFPHTVRGVLAGSEDARGQSLITLGLLLLIATPVARVALSIVIFAIEHDRIYALITTAVLLLLLASFAVGAAG